MIPDTWELMEDPQSGRVSILGDLPVRERDNVNPFFILMAMGFIEQTYTTSQCPRSNRPSTPQPW
jgi:hypothetical protein